MLTASIDRIWMISSRNLASRLSLTSGFITFSSFHWPCMASTPSLPSTSWPFHDGLDKSNPRSPSKSHAGYMLFVSLFHSPC